jgi:hypothetical protein
MNNHYSKVSDFYNCAPSIVIKFSNLKRQNL